MAPWFASLLPVSLFGSSHKSSTSHSCEIYSVTPREENCASQPERSGASHNSAMYYSARAVSPRSRLDLWLRINSAVEAGAENNGSLEEGASHTQGTWAVFCPEWQLCSTWLVILQFSLCSKGCAGLSQSSQCALWFGFLFLFPSFLYLYDIVESGSL